MDTPNRARILSTGTAAPMTAAEVVAPELRRRVPASPSPTGSGSASRSASTPESGAEAEAEASVSPPEATSAPAPERVAGSTSPLLFDVCHVGVVLRVLLAVHLLIAVAALFPALGAGPGAGDVGRSAAWVAWGSGVASGSAIVLPASLLWLLASCALKRPLRRQRFGVQAAAATLLGAMAGAVGWGVALLGSTADAAPALLPFAAAGALAGHVALRWLALRAQAQGPADTSARLAELQSRIRPHFLFNTLNTALGLIRLDPPRAEGVLEDLSELFRAALADDTPHGDGSVTLADEVELARRYLAIEQIRFGERLRVRWELDPAADGARVPPLLLQPLVENAVRHGVEPAESGGFVNVRTQARLGRAIVTIVNSVPAPSAAKPGHGIALRNVGERLRLMHDLAAELDVRREPGCFSIVVVVPL